MSFLNLLKKVKASGKDKWMACCPCHDDKTPSMKIKFNGKAYSIECYGCGANGVDVFRKLGIPLDELFGEASNSRFVPQRAKDEYEDDKWFIAVYKSAESKGERIAYKDKQRFRLAVARMKGIEERFKYYG